ncbi:MAG: VWA domain-containing protein [Tepidisphaerales bacterium]
MKYFYGEFDGQPFPTPDKLFDFNPFAEFLLEYGEQALKAMEQMLQQPGNPEHAELLEKLIQEGMLDKDGRGRLRLTPRAVSKMQRKALLEVFSNLKQGQRDGHEKLTPGPGAERTDGTKPYTYGDPVSDLDLHATLRNALSRHGLPARGQGIRFDDRDFEIHLREGTATCSTVVLIDLSGSMMRYGRFLSAKKVALAMQALVRSRFPQDTLDFVGFYSGAKPIPEVMLPLVMPKPVTVYDYQVRLRVPIDRLDKAPQHFTNLHMGLQIARRILRRRAGENKQLFIITDGQPTAHVEGNQVYLLYPPDQRSVLATLKEAVLCRQEGIRFATFALIEDYFGMDWVGFVDQLTRLTRGVAFYTSSGELASCIMESYLSGRKKKAAIG